MNFTTNYTPMEVQPNGWHQRYDPSAESTYYWNEQTNQSTWTLPKKIKQNWETYIPVESFISTEMSTDPSFFGNYVAFPPTLNLMVRCYLCNTQDDVQKHGYCKPCFDKINSQQDPLIAKFKVKCLGCRGWGLNLVKENGYCNHCYNNLKNGVPLRSYEADSQQFSHLHQSQFPKCYRCGGWGKDLVKENGMCNHCTREETRLTFEAKWKTKCKTCGGWGLGLVKEDGLCNHCRRQLANERVFFSKVLNQKAIKPDGGFKWMGFEDPLLGKRGRNREDDFEV